MSSFLEVGWWVSLVPGPFQWGWICPLGGYVQGGPLLLTPSGDHHMYGWQAGGTHHTGMYSCCFFGGVVKRPSQI